MICEALAGLTPCERRKVILDIIGSALEWCSEVISEDYGPDDPVLCLLASAGHRFRVERPQLEQLPLQLPRALRLVE